MSEWVAIVGIEDPDEVMDPTDLAVTLTECLTPALGKALLKIEVCPVEAS